MVNVTPSGVTGGGMSPGEPRRALQSDFGSISRTNDANALLAKLDFRLSQKHNASLKYNYTRSSQENGTFDVDFWGRSANALENDHSHAVNGSLTSVFSRVNLKPFWSRFSSAESSSA